MHHNRREEREGASDMERVLLQMMFKHCISNTPEYDVWAFIPFNSIFVHFQ